MHKTNVILIGFMGAGKTTVGRRLSYRLRKTFLDVDSYIEKKEGRTIKDIFKEEGETYFRELETQALIEMQSDSASHVISTGGGLPIKEENQKILKRMGTVIYLRTKPETVFQRIKHDTNRPLLQVSDPKGKINEMLNRRDPIYLAVADVVIDVDHKDFKSILNEVLGKLKKEGESN